MRDCRRVESTKLKSDQPAIFRIRILAFREEVSGMARSPRDLKLIAAEGRSVSNRRKNNDGIK